jgi:hypothetical protein
MKALQQFDWLDWLALLLFLGGFGGAIYRTAFR